MTTHVAMIYGEPKDREALEALARQRKASKSAVVRELIREAFSREFGGGSHAA